MNNRILHGEHIDAFVKHLRSEEKSIATIEKYKRDVERFWDFAKGTRITKDTLLSYKQTCVKQGYAVRSINSMLASIHSLMQFLGWHDCKVKIFRIQPRVYSDNDKELTKGEYKRLIYAAKADEQLYMILQTICATGIRVSELQHFTVENVRKGEFTVCCKGKTRTVLLPRQLQQQLLQYARKKGCKQGEIFVGRYGQSINRSAIWRKMKGLCACANVLATKVFPHNLRKLFARSFYAIEKDIAKLADVLGHSSINTTRIYIMTTGREHRKQLECLGLLL